ncbi:hypothetical protein BASA81_004886 [Batrachochytrium salamandrivorans]|nr:hypothetical protein BASA81_004886 [Batrachochytrium salamandrivorans]
MKVGEFIWLEPDTGKGGKAKKKQRRVEDEEIPPHAVLLQITHLFSNQDKFDGMGIRYLRAKDVFGARLLGDQNSDRDQVYKTMDDVKFNLVDVCGRFKLNDYFDLSPAVYDVRTKRIVSNHPPADSPPQQQQQKETIHQQASRMLQNSTRPSTDLPCRKRERDRIRLFMERGITNHGSKLGLYISGLPGSGKTFTVRQVVSSLYELGLEFDFLEINGLKVNSGDEVFHVLARHFLPTTVHQQKPRHSSSNMKMELDAYFRSKPIDGQPSHKPTVLLIDEMDQLVEEDDVLFQLFNFAQHGNAGLIIVAIANTLDLSDQVMAKIRSRLGEDKISFASYGKEDIEQILLDRVVDCNVFERDAISFCALKTASTSGDIRRAMRACNKALEYVEDEGNGLVTVSHITQAWMELETGSITKAIRFLSPLEKLVLISVSKLGNKTKFEPVYRRVINVGQLIPEVKI